MSKKANPTLVGLFVIGAILIAVACVVVFGGGKLFERKAKFVLYFKEAIDGLDVGAPVDFMGVRVGSVTDISLVVDGTDKLVMHRPVVIEIEENTMQYAGPEMTDEEVCECIEALVQQEGLRAQLVSQSMLTGKLKIRLAFFPKSPMAEHVNIKSPYAQLPTTPSPVQSFVKNIEQLPVKQIMEDLNKTLKGLSALVNAPATAEAITNLNASLVQSAETMRRVDQFIAATQGSMDRMFQDLQPLPGQIDHSLTIAANLLEDVGKLVLTLENKAGPFMDSLTDTSDNMNKMLDEQSPMRSELQRAVEELSNTLQAIRNLASYLELYPESLIRGKR